MATSKTTRRTFLKSAAATAGTLALGGLIPSSVLGANDRVNFGVIGVGGMGFGHLERLVNNREERNVGVPAVCDVYKRRLSHAQNVCGGDGYMDYRKLLDRKDIDAVLIATPDHWHSKISIDAMEAGKHVYCEKPMTLTVEQALEVRDTVKRTGKVFQVGPNRTADEQYWVAHEAIKNNRLGKVTWAQASYNRNIRGCGFNTWFLIDEMAGPHMNGEDYIDWDMWLGHKWGLAPRIPWNPEHFFRFRKYWPYNGGVATDLLYHMLAPLLIAITGRDGEYPYRVSANGGLYIEKDGRDIPDVFMIHIDYKSEFTVSLVSVLTNNATVPTKIYGRYGTIEFTGQPIMTGNGDFVKEFKEHNDGYTQVTLPAAQARDYYIALQDNFIQVIREGGDLYCGVDLGTATMVAIKLGVESYRQSKMMIWDAENEKLENA